jgi:phosphoenolpyruvate phosphomutase
MGVRDNNEASWTQVLDVLEFMSDATTIPILVDADTGYGNFNNVRRLVKKLEQRSVAAVCIEDKLFPKTNSLLDDEAQPLADVDEFCGKIRAAKDTQQDADFCVVARVEAFIAGWGLGEALRRAEAYAAAGADAVLIHSKQKTGEEILSFMQAWQHPTPVVIVPTTYYKTPTDRFAEAGVRLVIWANHMLRSSVRQMQETADRIYNERSLVAIEGHVAPVKEIFRLQNMEELKAAESLYLPAKAPAPMATVPLAAAPVVAAQNMAAPMMAAQIAAAAPAAGAPGVPLVVPPPVAPQRFVQELNG